MVDQKALVESVLNGDRRAFRTLVEENQRLVSHVVFRLIPSVTDREDICQEVFLKVYQNLSRFRFDAKLSTWIGCIARNCCLDFLEKKKLPLWDDISEEGNRVEPAAPESAAPDQVFQSGQIGELVRQEIDRLPPLYRTLVTLYHLDNLSYLEIAEIMKLPEGTVKSYLFRARRILKENLATYYQREVL